MGDKERFEKRLDRTINRYVDDLDAHEIEMLLQERAEEMRVLAYERGDRRVISQEDIEGYDG